MTESSLSPNYTQLLAGDIYRMQRRPGTGQLVVNDDYRGLRVIDPWLASDPIYLPFPTDYDSAGIIDIWCFRADGSAALVISSENGAAAWISLQEPGQAHALTYPPQRKAVGIRYVWDDTLLLIDTSGSFLELVWTDGQPSLVPRASIDVRLRHRAWRQALERLPTLCNVLRHEPDRARLLYYDHAAQPERIGVINWHNPSAEWAIVVPASVLRLAANNYTLFVLRDGAVWSWNQCGGSKAVYPVPDGYDCIDLETLPATSRHPSTLAILCTPRDRSANAQLLLYTLAD